MQRFPSSRPRPEEPARRRALTAYFAGIWEVRHFWLHLARSDLRSRWRRSFLGILWTVLQPLGLTLLFSVVFGRIFKIGVVRYLPYVLSGMVVWEFIVASGLAGSLAFVQADAYIRQTPRPLAIYTLRTVTANLVVLACASLSLIGWVLVTSPGNLGWSWLAALTLFPLLALIAWPLATVLAYFGVRYRDIPHALGLAFQAVWFVSPVMFEPALFRSGHLDALVDYNPVYHVLEIVRAPLLRGEWPTLRNYAFSLGTVLALSAAAVLTGRTAEAKVIRYL